MRFHRRIAVVVPAYQEEKLLPTTLAGMPAWVDRIYVVDDGSTDSTFAQADLAAASDSRIIVVKQTNSGVGAAIVAGYRLALQGRADVVAVMAGDNQMDPSDLESVVLPVASGQADYVKGNRLMHHERAQMPSVRRFGTQFLAKATGVLAGLSNLNDAQCGYTAISRQTLQALPLDRLYPRYGYPNDMLLRLSEIGARVKEVSVRPVYATEVSGLKITKVVGPISGILIRGSARLAIRRLVA